MIQTQTRFQQRIGISIKWRWRWDLPRDERIPNETNTQRFFNFIIINTAFESKASKAGERASSK